MAGKLFLVPVNALAAAQATCPDCGGFVFGGRHREPNGVFRRSEKHCKFIEFHIQ